MSGRDLFGVIVRTGGFAACAYGVYCLVTSIRGMLLGVTIGGFSQFSPQAILIYALAPGAAWLAGGVWLMHRPDQIVRFAYPYRSGACAKCGYDMRATPGRCPECGAVPET